ncbi:protein NRT1/ PTR FAMILY 1.2-like [Rhododendron vialii]|uniref:protein NRT1/ PTR FAMILY 1.2-like n=1 Tax=Rhododendron vialii TaxID=182163 RepID=UPI00266041A7|nr:protein NRT1/ PTR FAMILY 1.2-like [Rhododendron vialii]
MGVSTHENNMEQGQPPRRRQKGGLITMPFILANEALEKVATYGLLPNMILYLMGDYHIGITQGTNLLFFWSAATNFSPLVGAFISDSYLGRFLTIGLGSIFSLLGLVLLWITAMIPRARPPHCNQYDGESCKQPTGSQYAILLSSFMLMSIGAGGIRSCSLAFGADQLDQINNPNNKRVLEKYFSWYYTSIVVSLLIAFSVIVYIQDNAGWKVGFLVPVILMFLSALSFFVASPLYIKQKADTSLLTNLARVIVVCIKNRKVAFPFEESNLRYHHTSDSTLSEPSNKLRFLNKACIIRNPDYITPEGVGSNTWSLCTVEQVEALKVLIRVMPLWSSSIMISVNLSQGTFQLLQAESMNRHITPGFQLPAGSFTMFAIIGAIVWIVLYDRIIIPLASKIRGKPFSVGMKVRMGVGLFCSFLGMVVAAIVEHFRRRKAIESGYYNNPAGVVNMSAMWLVPQYVLIGVAEALNVIASNEFFYSELPKRMSSIAVALSGLGMAVGSLLASLILSTVNNVTKRGGKEGWISSNINTGHYESYYWLLAVLSSVNLLYFVLCCWAYGPCADQGFSKLQDEGKDDKDLKEEELHILGNGVTNGEGKSEEDGA